jgi:lysophospholipase
VDSNWPACVGCAVLARSLVRTGTDMPAKCVDCFARYCWNGTTNSTIPSTYEPELMVSGGIRDRAPWLSVIEAAVFVTLVLLI